MKTALSSLLVLPVGILLTGVALTMGEEVAAQDTVLQGTFVYDTNAAQSADVIQKAIDTAVAKMNFITRPIARGRLKKTNPLYQRIEIAQAADQISVRFDNGKPVLMPADGRSVKWTRDDGEVFDVNASVRSTELVQTFKAEDGQRLNQFSLGPDSNALTLDVTLSSPQLPAPVKYTLKYRRGEAQ